MYKFDIEKKLCVVGGRRGKNTATHPQTFQNSLFCEGTTGWEKRRE